MSECRVFSDFTRPDRLRWSATHTTNDEERVFQLRVKFEAVRLAAISLTPETGATQLGSVERSCPDEDHAPIRVPIAAFVH
jgi:hypothetical protein